MRYQVGNTFVTLKRADITEEETDAIVNAANSRLQHGGGVAGAIVRKGGKVIQDESNKIGFVPVGSAVLTTAGSLKAKYIIHAVGPQMGEGNEEKKLRNATWNSLLIADKNKIHSIAFPAISTGIFGYPVERCAEIMLSAVNEYARGKTSISEIHFCLFDERTLQVFITATDSLEK